MLNRRSVILTGAAALMSSAMRPRPGVAGSPGAAAFRLSAGGSLQQLLPEDYAQTSVWTFNGSAPGPELRVRAGDRIHAQVHNGLPEPTTVHWHGVRIDNSMDGVPGLVQAPIGSGECFDYEFVVPDAGTFWYHSHNRSFEQVARGLYGALVVEEAVQPDVDREELLIFDDWLIDPATAQLAGNFGAMHDLSHGGRLGNLMTTNGAYQHRSSVGRNERLRLRMINASNSRILQLNLHGLDGVLVALDGMPLAEVEPINGPVILAPAQRADLIVDVVSDAGSTATISHVERGGSIGLANFEVTVGGTQARRGTPSPLTPNEIASPDLSDPLQLDLEMAGGAMGGLRSARLDGREMTMRDLAAAGQFWAFNGAVGSLQAAPLARIELGRTVQVRMINDTAFPHGMHLHGMHFHEVGSEGELGPLRDTTLLASGQTRTIVFVANNPGRWLLHCHMLEHAAAGMIASIEVA